MTFHATMKVRPALPEAAFRHWIIEAADRLGWSCYAIEQTAQLIRVGGRVVGKRSNVNNSGRGFPDLVLVHRATGVTLFRELKKDPGPRGGTSHRELTPEQRIWADALGKRNDYGVWRPGDELMIITTLTNPRMLLPKTEPEE